jgi:hypothetical protein
MGKNNKKKTTEDYKKEVFDLVGEEFIVLNEYINTHTPIKMKHSKCKNELEIAPTHFLGGTRCRYCSYKENSAKKKYSTEEVSKVIKEISENKYELLSEYKSSNEKLKIKHLECGNEFDMKYRFFVNMGQRCPVCRKSKGEEKIEAWLKNNNFKFNEQKRFKDCKDERPLPFDFQVLLEKEFILIEYDGIQHFEERFNFSNSKEKDSVVNIQKRDQIKNDFCNKNNIKLLRINHLDYDNIEKILENYFK